MYMHAIFLVYFSSCAAPYNDFLYEYSAVQLLLAVPNIDDFEELSFGPIYHSVYRLRMQIGRDETIAESICS